MAFNPEELYERLKSSPTKYKEEIHCPMILALMGSSFKGTVSAFCVKAEISETQFYNWCQDHPLFKQCYEVGKMVARENWEDEGRALRDHVYEKGESGHNFEYWRMIGWSRFGVGKNSRIRLNLNANDNPSQHYAQLLKQASEGDFTSGEIKQLMEAVNVGLNAHQVFELQKEIDALKSDLEKMQTNINAQNTYTTKGIA
jgi:coproporphyrinogen III oxidase-like Fe-S oxidoreductase